MEEVDHAIMIFNADLTHRVSSKEFRLPSNYIGVRRVRPSSMAVQSVMTGSIPTSQQQNNKQVVYRIKDPETGEERRMTSQEKRDLRFKLRKEQKEEKRAKRKLELEQQKADEAQSSSKRKRKTSLESVTNALSAMDSRYMALPVDPASVEQEISDLRGERDGVPPVTLAPYQARLFLGKEPLNAVLDDDLAKEWTVALKESMSAAEVVRKGEDMRAMVYDLIPEVWSRMRPEWLLGTTRKPMQTPNLDDNHAWSSCTIRPATTSFDRDIAAVSQVLHQGMNLHLSCGAKFGCDLLLYERPRAECHAFAGLRVLSCKEGELWPLPTAYSMTGYVRCLNTAAKLALVAFVKRERDAYRVAVVDMSLIKIASTVGRRSGSGNNSAASSS